MKHIKVKTTLLVLICTVLIISQCSCTNQLTLKGRTKGTETQPISSGQSWLLNTLCTITIYEEGKDSLITECFQYARDCENTISRTVESSEVYAVNSAKAGEKVEISPELAELFKESMDISVLSDSCFDVTIGSVSELWDFSSGEGTVPTSSEIKTALSYIGAGIELVEDPNGSGSETLLGVKDINTYYLIKDNDGLKLDFGAIGKGYIEDLAADFLRDKGIKSAVLNFGGNVAVIGEKEDGTAWNIGLEEPKTGQETDIDTRDYLGVISLVPDMNVSTSGTFEKFIKDGDKVYHHVLDPMTGYSAETDLVSASVVGPVSALCDAYATTCLIMGSEEGMALIENNPKLEDYECIFIKTDGTILKSSGANFEPIK